MAGLTESMFLSEQMSLREIVSRLLLQVPAGEKDLRVVIFVSGVPLLGLDVTVGDVTYPILFVQTGIERSHGKVLLAYGQGEYAKLTKR